MFAGEESATGYKAKSWPRGDFVSEAGDVAAFGDHIDIVNSESALRMRRVAVWVARGPEALAGLIRHELEHTLQFDADRDGVLSELHRQAIVVMDETAVGVPRNEAGEIIGGGELYNTIPMEVDANAAASSFVRSRFGDDRIDHLVDCGDVEVALFRRTCRRQPVATIRSRMEEFASRGAAQEAIAFITEHGTP